MSLVKNTKNAFLQIPINARIIQVVMPALIILFLLINGVAIGFNVYLMVWGSFLAITFLAGCFTNACESAFYDSFKVELDEIKEREIKRYDGNENIRRDLWKSHASRASLECVLPDEMLNSPLVPSISFWKKIANWGLFFFILLPILVFFWMRYFAELA